MARGRRRQEVGCLELEIAIDAHGLPHRGSARHRQAAGVWQQAAGPGGHGCSVLNECPEPYGSAPTAASADGRGSRRWPPRCSRSGAGRPWAAGSSDRTRGPSRPPAEARSADRRASIRCPCAGQASVPALGDTQIQSIACGTGSVPLVSMATVKPALVEGVDQSCINLQHGLAAGQHHQKRASDRPGCRAAGAGQILRARELAAPAAVGADEVGIAELADGARRDPARGLSTDCSRQNGRRRRACPRSRPRLAACRRSP